MIDEVLKVEAAARLSFVLEKQRSESKVSKKDFTNSLYALELVELANAHIKYVTFYNFRQRLLRGDIKCKGVVKILTNLCMLFGLNIIHTDSKMVYQTGYFGSGVSYSELVLNAIKQINIELRPQAISIVESFGIRDEFLQTAIGNKYGDIYETHLKWAKESRLN